MGRYIWLAGHAAGLYTAIGVVLLSLAVSEARRAGYCCASSPEPAAPDAEDPFGAEDSSEELALLQHSDLGAAQRDECAKLLGEAGLKVSTLRKLHAAAPSHTLGLLDRCGIEHPQHLAEIVIALTENAE